MANPRPGPCDGWTLVLPLKGGPAAKSRLRCGPELARAIATDCLDAVLAAPLVRHTIVVTADPTTADWASEAGAVVVRETRPGSGLVAAVRDGLAAVDAGPAGVLLGDLPALRPSDLAAALGAVRKALDDHPLAPMAAVPDAEGSGTVLLAGASADRIDPAFGPGSLVEHLGRGAVPVTLDAPRLRHDVDTWADLLVALALGVGPRTAEVLLGVRTAG